MRSHLLAVAAVAIIALGSRCDAAFLPLTLEKKCAKADLVVVGRVVSMMRLDVPKSSVPGEPEGFYMGPTALAVVEISVVWKDSGRLTRAMMDKSGKAHVAITIFVPCDYRYEESPSELTVGQTYVLFLESLTANLFHPLDPASMHVLHHGRVAKFGMNHPPGKDFGEQSIEEEEFKKKVMKAIADGTQSK